MAENQRHQLQFLKFDSRFEVAFSLSSPLNDAAARLSHTYVRARNPARHRHRFDTLYQDYTAPSQVLDLLQAETIRNETGLYTEILSVSLYSALEMVPIL